jgi:hypothetical protein
MAETSMIRVSPWVTHECLDDEVIAINLESGAYFVLEGAAADCWSSLVDGASPDDVVRRLLGRYEVTEERARADATSVLAELQDAGMLVVEEGESGSIETLPGGTVPYAQPSVQKYDDLQDLLLLDPIHEVDDAGWPVARPD